MYKPISYILVEDSQVDELYIHSLLEPYSQLRSIGTAANAAEAVTIIHATKPDLVFMDIDLPDLSGIELLRSFKSIIPMTVFTTSHGEYALEGFELAALDYLIKPIEATRFQKTIKRIEEYWQMIQQAAAYQIEIAKETITIKEGYNKIQVRLKDISYLEAMQDYTKVVTNSKKYMVNLNLSSFVLQLPEDTFIRLHRSYAVLKSNIQVLRKNEVVCKGITLPISKTYRSKLANLML